MIEEKIPVLLFPWKTVRQLGRKLKGLGGILEKLSPDMGITLSKIGVDVEPGAYAVASLLSSFLYGLLIFAIVLIIMAAQGKVDGTLLLAVGAGAGMWLLFFILHMIYPPIVLKKIAIKENRDMLFALREIMIDVNSGVPLFQALKNAGDAGYGYVSLDFVEVTREIERGVPEKEALKRLAIKTESEHLKRAIWQMVNALESGASLKGSISGIVESVEEYIYRDIKNYSSNLNFLMLLYMFAAAVVPSLGVTFLVLLSAFSDFGVTVETVGLLVGFSAITQVVMIGYMGSTRPEIFGG
ncbi:type II secretion system F family protein [Candidatus Micrarchaeota archaeon]|nr:type II secretion system F family protein [Candidatus Micrarchaeota archaeon]